MRNLVATILVLMLAGCAGDQKSRQAGIQQGDLSRPFVSEQVPVRDVLPSPHTTPVPQAESRAEVVSLPDTDIRSTASNNATQQSATGLVNTQMAKFTESIEASLLRLDSKIVAQNEMTASFRNDMSAQASAIASVRADVSALAQGQAGIGNEMKSVNQTVSAGRDSNTQFTDGMERMITAKDKTIYWIVAAFVGTYFTSVGAIVAVFVKLLKEKELSREREEKRRLVFQEKLLGVKEK